MNPVILLVFAVGGLWVIQKIVGYRNALRAINYFPGHRTVFDIRGMSSLLPRIPYITGGRNGGWKRKHDLFAKLDRDIISFAATFFVVADPGAIKEITASRQRFPKPVEMYKGLQFFGNNIVVSEAEEWKRYRKICGPSFSEPNNKLVWDETVKIVHDLFDNVWGSRKEIVYEHALEVTMPDTLHTVSDGFIVKLLTPKWAVPYKKRFRQVIFAFEELERHMHEMIDSRRNAEKKEERYDLLSSLLDANDDPTDGQSKLTDQELLANIFIFLIAGHETTAHSLCFSFGLLALYQDEQDRAYQEIQKALPGGRDPTMQDIPALSFIEGIMNETLRMYPPVVSVPKISAEDTTLSTTNSAGEKIVIPVPAGVTVNLHAVGLHYNPKYWTDPYKFSPERFLGDWPRDAFLPFSGGKYKITVKEDPAFAGETFEQKKERVLKAKGGLTLTPVRMPLVFTRRDW
ncbi:hypothetical protein EUX98_g3138 [Antrodiella citrinella]|uniref:Cytochrome P450 n=1 Tax=Antrodiella citrinella TaxID=2447956 RepID=A0A4S4MXB1_9APHY|nr:hypothetical protein EUX98_g3138 [Antrodiella citrinella]